MRGAGRRRRVAAAVGLSLLFAALWLGYDAFRIHRELVAARTGMEGVGTALRAGDGVETRVEAVRRHTNAAASAANDPLWRAASLVPIVGRSFSVVREMSLAAQAVATDVVPPGQRAAELVRGRPILQNGQVDLARLETLRAPVGQAARAVLGVQRRLARSPRHLIPGPVARERDALEAQVDRLAGSLTSADAALRLAPGMLGQDGPRRYFLAVQNNAEARGTGGIIGAYAVLRADRGRVTRERVGTDRDFVSQERPVADLGPEYAEHYDSQSGRTYWTAAVLTPDWPSAARVVAGLWSAQGGGRVDGVIGIDPLAMAAILRATGPVSFDGMTVTGDTVADFVMRDEYAIFEKREAARQRVLTDLAAAVYDGVVRGTGSSTALISALAAAGGSGHLQVWSAHPAEQQVLAPLRAGAALPSRPGAFLEVVSNNAAGNKADYYVRRAVGYRRNGKHRARVTLTLTNTVDPERVPPVVIGREGGPPAPERGATRQLITFYVGAGQRVRAVAVDGQPAPMESGTERRHGWATVQVEIRPSRPTVVTADIDDPGGQLLYRQQPLAVPDRLALRVPYRIG